MDDEWIVAWIAFWTMLCVAVVVSGYMLYTNINPTLTFTGTATITIPNATEDGNLIVSKIDYNDHSIIAGPFGMRATNQQERDFIDTLKVGDKIGFNESIDFLEKK
jgi:hypothetical protein